MKTNIVEINMHGVLGEVLGRRTWKYNCKTVGQALNAIEILSKRKLYKNLLENDKKGIKYRVLINGKDFTCQETPVLEKPETIKNSELYCKIDNLKSIDIIPVLEGAGGNVMNIISLVVGVILVVVGIVIIVAGGPYAILGVGLVIAGLGLIAAGIINLLSQGPELQQFKEKQKTSFLFSGPVNTVNEGGPIPIGYGRLIIGSFVISASYEIDEFNTGYKSTDNVNSKSGK